MTDDVIKQALDRIARTADGAVLYRYLQRELCALCHDASDGALRRHEGKRTLASDLMALMAEGIDASVPTEHFIPAKRESASAKRKLSAREWIAAQPSWVDDPIYSDSEPAVGSTSGA